jgi:hypothetical protein
MNPLASFWSAMSSAANLVSMVCNWMFDIERMLGEITETKYFDGTVYVKAHLDGGDVSRVWVLLIGQNRRTAPLDFIKNISQ